VNSLMAEILEIPRPFAHCPSRASKGIARGMDGGPDQPGARLFEMKPVEMNPDSLDDSAARSGDESSKNVVRENTGPRLRAHRAPIVLRPEAANSEPALPSSSARSV